MLRMGRLVTQDTGKVPVKLHFLQESPTYHCDSSQRTSKHVSLCKRLHLTGGCRFTCHALETCSQPALTSPSVGQLYGSGLWREQYYPGKLGSRQCILNTGEHIIRNPQHAPAAPQLTLESAPKGHCNGQSFASEIPGLIT